jgi:hypothetical protein
MLEYEIIIITGIVFASYLFLCYLMTKLISENYLIPEGKELTFIIMCILFTPFIYPIIYLLIFLYKKK